MKNRVAVIKYLISCNADKEMLDENGVTPIIVAVAVGNATVVHILATTGANIYIIARII